MSALIDLARTAAIEEPYPLDRALAPRPARSRLVVLSHRAPITGPSETGLASALEPALHGHDGTWLGWSGRESAGDRAPVLDDSQPAVASFDLPAARARSHLGFCHRALSPLFHGFPGRARYSDADWLAYVDVNAEFARHAAGLVAADGAVWAHDHHLLLVARALRQRGFRGRAGLFLHVPFPARDVLDTLPWADDLIAAMLAFDVIGVHTEEWAANLRASVRTRLAGSHVPDIAVLPLGVDRTRFASPPRAHDELTGLHAALAGRRMILGVDRLDYTKGIPERLLGFECLLEHFPHWRGHVTLVQIAVPPRDDGPDHAELRHRIETLVGRINGRFGEADWVPVRYVHRSYDPAVLVQLYRAADVALITPLRDGLNLIAKEFVVAQDPDRPGVLVLSKFAGAAAELADAVVTNPYHLDGLARDIDRALQMPLDERRHRHARMTTALADNTPQRWAAAFLDRLLR